MPRQYLLEGPTLPPIEIFRFLIPISLQCLFLHPVFPSSFSRPARFLLMPLSLVLSFVTPYKYAIEPRNQGIGVNFVIGIMGAYGVMKCVEWGVARDLLPYTWVGFDEADQNRTDKAQPSAAPAQKARMSVESNGHKDGREDPKEVRRRQREQRREYLEALRRRQAETEGPIQIIRSTLHLLVAMRGQGYEFCGTSTEPFALDHIAFFRRILLEIAWSHPLLVLCAAILLEPPTSRDALLASFLPSLSPSHAHLLGESITGLSMGTAVFAALTLGYSCATLLAFLATKALRALPIPDALLPPPFDPREYPPLFNFAERPQSVAIFWSKQWHSFFSRPFRFLAFDPTQRLFTPFAGRNVGRTVGVLAVFALSSWIHEFGLATSTSTLPPLDLSLLTRWGGSVYFMSQGLAIVCEGAFTALTRRKTGGWVGTVWSSFFIVYCGLYLYRSWMTQGLVREVPPVWYWSWQRVVVPLGCLQPPPIWMNSWPETYAFERAV
ncbi:hypothetical protein Rhopal_003510-T1 [Rhodotorula paludigena]|uniref:Wax synthase domain-containing protein n=1 Tax=Rhodotorula paludigena TaxID=86838 RepID=A0AAV5GMN3_9BASI|nr:hypothetical protein Rhopal_003510-T1 [Rhodotorula paludigena]